MPPNRQNNRGRGGGRGGARPAGAGGRWGGPKLPGGLKEELGLPAQRGRGRGGFKPRSSRPNNNEEDDADLPPPQRQNFKAGTTRRLPLPPSAAPKPTPQTAPSPSPPPPAQPETDIDPPRPGKKRKISASTSTPLSRLLDPTPAAGKQPKEKMSAGEAPLDPGIMKRSGRSRQEQEEDEEIRWLEWKLNHKGGKGKGKAKATGDEEGMEGGEDDGLDDLLNFADSVVKGSGSGAGGMDIDGEEDEEDEEDEEGETGDEDEDEDEDMDTHSSALGSENELADFYTTDEDDDDDQMDTSPPQSQAGPSTSTLPKPPRPQVRFQSSDDGFPTASASATLLSSSARYIPPSLRGKGDRVTPAEPSPSPEEEQDGEDRAEKDKEDKDAGHPYRDVAKSAKDVDSDLRLQAEEKVEGKGKGKEEVDGEGKVKSEEQRRLERRLQGLLNKLSEANIDGILGEVEVVYRNNSRNSVTTTLTTLILATISDRSNLSDSFIILYAALSAALYKIIGREFGGHLIQELMTLYISLTSPTTPTPTPNGISELLGERSKQPLNLLVMIAELYNLHVISCRLVYDLIRGFIEGLTLDSVSGQEAQEGKVEGLLRLLRCSGGQLRTDDPASLRDIVALVQGKTAGFEEGMSVRTKFMVETLVNVKNNKIRAVPGGEAGAEARTKMKKFLGGLEKKRHVMVHEPLRVSLSDLHSASTKGKWWLVGAAWNGDPLAERAAEHQREQELAGLKSKRKGDEQDELDVLGMQDGEVLMKLARKQGMNTDVRRGVFVVIMSSDDYQHACDRLAGLKYTETQQREFVRVVLHCLGVEPAYNPYYALILTNLCTDSYSHRFTLQYALWDFLRELGETDVGGAGTVSTARSFDSENKVSRTRIANIAMATAWAAARLGVDLTVFKPVDFSNLQSKTKQFFRTFFSHLFLASQTSSPTFKLPRSLQLDESLVEILFGKTLTITGLAQGVSYFLTTEMKAATLAKGRMELSERQMEVVLWGVGVAKGVVLAAL